MRILFLDQFSEPGGAQLCLQDLMPEIIRRGWQPLLMVPGDGVMVRWSRSLDIPTYGLPLGRYSNGRKTPLDFVRFTGDVPRMASAVNRVVEREGVDLIYVNGPRVLPAVLGAHRPIVFHAHSRVASPHQRRFIRWILRSTNARAIAASQFVAEGLESAQVIYNGVADLRNGLRTFTRQTARIGIIGRIAPEKGHIDFVRAAIEIARAGGDAEFFVYGETLFADAAYDARVRAMAEGTPIKFCGWANDISRALRDLEILAVPSGPNEAATRVILEAFSAGTPVVAYRAGGIPELLEHGRTGLLTDAPDAGSLAHSIQILLRDRSLLERLASEGRGEWQRRFRVERFRDSVCDLLERRAQNAKGTHREVSARALGDGEAAASR